MVEYISRKYFLTEEEFQAEKICNQSLVELFQKKYGWHSLNDFGSSTYDKNYASIFYEYWRSFLTIDKLVENLGSVQAVSILIIYGQIQIKLYLVKLVCSAEIN